MLWALQIESRKLSSVWRWTAASDPTTCPAAQPILTVGLGAVRLDGLHEAGREYTLPTPDGPSWTRSIAQAVLADLGEPVEATVSALLPLGDPIAFAPPPAMPAPLPAQPPPVRALLRVGPAFATTVRGLFLVGPQLEVGAAMAQERLTATLFVAGMYGQPKGIRGLESGKAADVGATLQWGAAQGTLRVQAGVNVFLHFREINYDITLDGSVYPVQDQLVVVSPEPTAVLQLSDHLGLMVIAAPRFVFGEEDGSPSVAFAGRTMLSILL